MYLHTYVTDKAQETFGRDLTTLSDELIAEWYLHWFKTAHEIHKAFVLDNLALSAKEVLEWAEFNYKYTFSERVKSIQQKCRDLIDEMISIQP